VRVRAEVESMIYEPPESIASLSPADLEALCRVLRKVAPEGAPNFSHGRF
jgi:hypothetical protein